VRAAEMDAVVLCTVVYCHDSSFVPQYLLTIVEAQGRKFIVCSCHTPEVRREGDKQHESEQRPRLACK
jgi:hypothetical protein